MLIDYHVHNRFSSDSKIETKEIIEKMKQAGVKEFCITNHIETFIPEGGDGDFSYEEAIERFKKVKEDIEENQKNQNDVAIKFGAELEYHEGWMDDMAKVVKNLDFDFLIGSVHEVDGVIVSSPTLCGELYKKMDEETAYKKYFGEMKKMVEWGHFDVTGHFDICKKGGVKHYGEFKPEKYEAEIKEILNLMKEKGIGIELNTGGLRHPCDEIYPHPTILKWALEAGIENFTISSDGHTVEQVGSNIEEGLTLAKEVGIKAISVYTKRAPKKIKI